MSILEVKNLSIKFGGVHALKNLSFSLEPASFVGLMGPNGAGKTTALNCISRIYPYDDGQIIFDGQDLGKFKAHDLSRLGVSRTYQNLNFFNRIADMSVLDYLKIGQFQHGRPSFFGDGLGLRPSIRQQIELKKRARRILEFLREVREELEPPQEERGYPILYGRGGFPDLLDVENNPISTLSFAWRRRLDLARALVSNPRLLLLDEPSQGLAPSEIANLAQLLKRIGKDLGAAALIIEHNVGMLMTLSEKIIVMSYGEKIAEGTPEEISQNSLVSEVYLGSGALDTSKKYAAQKAELRSNDDQPVLEVKSLDVFYGNAQALSSVSVRLYARQVACVLGTNGSGKSTLMKAIAGIEEPAFGQIYVKGELLPLGSPETSVERGIHTVPQGHVIFPKLTVMENLKVGAHICSKKGIKPDYDRVFHFFPDLKNYLDRQGNDLSGGQQQMLAIAQAIVGKPDVLLLDEPSLGLSPRYVETLFDIIHRISVEEKCAILIVEQNVAKALEISDYCFMFNSGTLISEGPTHYYRENTALVKKNLGFY